VQVRVEDENAGDERNREEDLGATNSENEKGLSTV